MTDRTERLLDEIRGTLAACPRMHGYYLLKVVDLPAGWQSDEEMALTTAFQALDDHEWPNPEHRPEDQLWSDYEVAEEVAQERAIAALVGGNLVGHSRDTIERTLASEIWLRFRELFSPSARFFVGLGLGDSEYVFSEGAIVVDEARAGCLCVVEGD